MAYLSLPHSSINASKSSHLNSWKTLQWIPFVFLLACISSRDGFWKKLVKGSKYCCHSSDCCFWNLILRLCGSALGGICYSSLKLCEKVKSWISFCWISEVCFQMHIQGIWLFLLPPSPSQPTNPLELLSGCFLGGGIFGVVFWVWCGMFLKGGATVVFSAPLEADYYTFYFCMEECLLKVRPGL